jgi:hypothetical protein
MYLYCETWKLKVNAAKTNVVIFSKSRQGENIDFIYNNERLTVVDEFQYLGTIFSRTLKPLNQIKPNLAGIVLR